MANFDNNEFAIAPENSRKVVRAPYGVRLISYNAGHRPIFLYIQAPAGARTICDHASENSYKSSGARAIIKFVGDVQIGDSYDVSFICDHSLISLQIKT